MIRTSQRIPNWNCTRPYDSVISGLISQDKLIISPDLDIRRAIFRTEILTLIPRGFLGDQEIADKPITNPSRENKPRIPPRQKEDFEKNFLQLLQSPRVPERARGSYKP